MPIEKLSQDTLNGIIRVLLDRRPQTLARELGIPLEDGSAVSVFRMLCAAALFSVREKPQAAMEAFHIITRRGWTTPQTLSRAPEQERVNALEEAGYDLFDEQVAGARRLGGIAEAVMVEYNGDVLNLRKIAAQDPDHERRLLKNLQGMGNAEADIFLREMQVAWDELYPFLDITSVNGARRLGIEGGVKEIARFVSRADLPRLAVELGQVELTGSEREICESAARLQGV